MGGEEIGFVCHGAHGGFVYLSLYPHSFGLLLLLSHSCLDSFLLMLWTMHMAPLFKCTQCLLSPLCLNFTLFFWCFGICIWSTLQMHPMLGATRTSLNIFLVICQRISRRDQQILIFCLWQSFFWLASKLQTLFSSDERTVSLEFEVCVCVFWCVVRAWEQTSNFEWFEHHKCTMQLDISNTPPSPTHTHTHTHTHTLTLSPSTNCQPLK